MTYITDKKKYCFPTLFRTGGLLYKNVLISMVQPHLNIWAFGQITVTELLQLRHQKSRTVNHNGFKCQLICKWLQSSEPFTLFRASCLCCSNASDASSICLFCLFLGTFLDKAFHFDSNTQAAMEKNSKYSAEKL